MEHSGNISIFSIPGSFGNIPGIYHGNVSRIFHEHIFVRWVKLLIS